MRISFHGDSLFRKNCNMKKKKVKQQRKNTVYNLYIHNSLGQETKQRV